MKNNKQQTAVEWIIKQLIFKTEFENLPNQYVLMSDKNIDNIIQQAKEMEKQQIEDAELRSKEIIIIKHTEHEGGKK
jgi:hypothetical protein